ncbi:hypothetical protein SELMODRAFT_420537 [Selaginella moellendorffii]|uniref:Uncharacterized protein n=1 Tax=Selaginella moellendorffii TaxID=88036 RepID=D8SCB4_SELML|nr:hypothetical protein SELMODRAFT_420537 [Selaginella moellendorffii]
MDITGVEEQGDGGDELHQGSLETSLLPEIVALGHVADRPMVVYDSDGGGLEDHAVPPPPFLEGSSSTPLTFMELLDNFFTVELLECQQQWIDATNAFNEAVQLTTQDSANFIMLQHEEVSALQDAITALEVRAQEDAEILLHVQWLKHKLLGCFGVKSTSDEEMLNAVARHSKFHWAGGSINMPPSIVKFTIAWFFEKRDLRRNWAATQQLKELFDTAETLYCHALTIQTCLYTFEVVSHSGATHWHPRMLVHFKTLRQEQWDVVVFVGWLLFQAFECNAQDFGENFYSWIVHIIRDMSLKELFKFHHFAIDSLEF